MSQHDFEITPVDANSGASMRAAMNAALQALASNSLGANEPTTTYAGMWWFDSAAGIMRQRNADNTAWEFGFGYAKNYFINPNLKINQQGNTVPEVGKYLFDCWKVKSLGTTPSFSVNGEEITLTGIRLEQINDDIIDATNGVDTDFTVSVESGSIAADDSAGQSAVVSESSPFTLQLNSSSNDAAVSIGSVDGTVYTFTGLKMTMGSRRSVYETPKVTGELLKCCRYGVALSTGAHVAIGIVDSTGTSVSVTIKTNVTMSSNVLTFRGSLRLYDGSGNYTDIVGPVACTLVENGVKIDRPVNMGEVAADALLVGVVVADSFIDANY